MPKVGMGALSTRKWLIALLSSSVGIALCALVYHQTRHYFYGTSSKKSYLFLTAWQWLQAFLFAPNESNSTESSHPRSSGEIRGIPPNITLEESSESSMPSDATVSELSTRRVLGSPRVVVLSTRHVRIQSVTSHFLRQFVCLT